MMKKLFAPFEEAPKPVLEFVTHMRIARSEQLERAEIAVFHAVGEPLKKLELAPYLPEVRPVTSDTAVPAETVVQTVHDETQDRLIHARLDAAAAHEHIESTAQLPSDHSAEIATLQDLRISQQELRDV